MTFIANFCIIYTVWKLSIEEEDEDEKFKSANFLDKICKFCLRPENLTKSVREELKILSANCDLNFKPLLISKMETNAEEPPLDEELLLQSSDLVEGEDPVKLSMDTIEQDETSEDLRTTIFLFIYRLFSHWNHELLLEKNQQI